MRIGSLNFELWKSSTMFGYDVRMCAITTDLTPRVTALAKPIEFEPYTEGHVVPPCLSIDEDDIQNMMDSLWSAGIRPSNGEGNVGQIGALKDHLADIKEDKKFYQGILEKTVNQ